MLRMFNSNVMDNRETFKIVREFYDDRWKNRIITCLDWSHQYPELVLSSYENGIHEGDDGVALVWNLKFEKSTPEFIFNCTVSSR